MSGTESELVFWGMSKAELLEALDYLRDLLTTWQRTHRISAFSVATTDGPRKLLDAMQLAWLRESERRYGVTPWEYPEPLPADHYFGGLLEIYERLAVDNPDASMRRPNPRDRGQYRTCTSCFSRYPLDDGHWSRVALEGVEIGFAVICKGCEAADDYRRERERESLQAQRDSGFWDGHDSPAAAGELAHG